MIQNDQFSMRVFQRLESLAFRYESEPLTQSTFYRFDYDVPYSNGRISFFLNLIEEIGIERVEKIGYVTNIHGPELAFIDVAAELMRNRQSHQVGQLSLREIDNYLRDSNEDPAFKGNSNNLFRIFGFISALDEALKARGVNRIAKSNNRASPEFEKDYRPTMEGIPAGAKYEDMALKDKYETVERVLSLVVRPFLQKDGGDVECVHIGEGMVVINYRGSCVSCESSLTSTMDYIQKVLRTELNDQTLMVVTDS